MITTIDIILAILGFLFGGGFLLFLGRNIFRLGEFNNRFNNLEKSFRKLEDRLDNFIAQINSWSNKIIQLINSHELRLSVIEYGRSGSPIVLKDEYRPFIKQSGLDKQIEKHLPKLLQWLKQQKPPTGIDAQDKVASLVSSGKIEKYLDLTRYKQYLYKQGKTSKDVVGILTLYLFEVLIPKIKFSGVHRKNSTSAKRR